MSLTTAKRSQTVAHKWVFKAIQSLEEIVSDKDSDIVDLDEGLSELIEQVSVLTEAQNRIESLLPEEELDQDVEDTAEICKQLSKVRREATKLLQKLNSSNHSDNISVSSSAKLPKLELPKFSGDVTEWQTFWDKFKATVDKSDIPNVNKFAYLQSLLLGDAKKAVVGLSLTSAHYKVVCDLLEKHFGRKEKIVLTHIQGLLSVCSMAQGSKITQL